MTIFRSIDKVLARFGNIRAMERTHVDTYTENLIKNIAGKKIAQSTFGQLWVEVQELSGYHFLDCTFLSGTNIKTLKGGTLIFNKEGKAYTFKSDTKEITSDFSNVSCRWMTKVSFIIEKKDLKFILNKDFDTVVFQFKKKQLEMNKI